MSRALRKKILDGIFSQGWDIIGRGGSVSAAFRPADEYVAAKIARAVKAEREACAKVCDVTIPGDEYLTAVINSYADSIRARGQQ